MIWPLNKLRPGSLERASGLLKHAEDPTYVSRPRLERAISEALDRGENLVIYGPPRLGKTTLLNRQLGQRECVYMDCRPDFKRTQIYRVTLSSLGYALLVEKKRSGKASTTVKFGIFKTGVEASAEGELEQTMQSVTVDLKNATEVAHLMSRIKRVPLLVLDNFQALSQSTRENLLFDLKFFAERSSIRVVIVGAWSQQDYLEEMEPAVAGKFRYVAVPSWTETELRQAAEVWRTAGKVPVEAMAQVDRFVELAAGDMSLFRALMEGSCTEEGAPAGADAVQQAVMARFQRGLGTKLRAIFEERDMYVSYLGLRVGAVYRANPKFEAGQDDEPAEHGRTSINPETNEPYADGRQVRLDAKGNPEYLQEMAGELEDLQADIGRFLMREFREAVGRGESAVPLANLVAKFLECLDVKPVALDATRVEPVFRRFEQVQERAMVVPRLLAIDARGEAMEIVDRRLYLFLQGTTEADLEDLMDGMQPRVLPTPRRRNRLSAELTAPEKTALAAEELEKQRTVGRLQAAAAD